MSSITASREIDLDEGARTDRRGPAAESPYVTGYRGHVRVRRW
ncbi:hypothetical protein ACWF2L_19330 [Streptomyces anulatus]